MPILGDNLSRTVFYLNQPISKMLIGITRKLSRYERKVDEINSASQKTKDITSQKKVKRS